MTSRISFFRYNRFEYGTKYFILRINSENIQFLFFVKCTLNKIAHSTNKFQLNQLYNTFSFVHAEIEYVHIQSVLYYVEVT